MHPNTFNKQDPRFKAVKSCLDKAALTVFKGHATVQAQGSVVKGTAVAGLSDWDHMVRLTDALPTVTRAQRMEFVNSALAYMKAEGIQYTAQPGVNTVYFFKGTLNSEPLPDMDVVWERFPGEDKPPADNKAMAQSPNGQAVCRYIKAMQNTYTNLNAPDGMYLEALVLAVEKTLGMADRKHGPAGERALLKAALEAIAEYQDKLLQKAGMNNDQWRCAARLELNKL